MNLYYRWRSFPTSLSARSQENSFNLLNKNKVLAKSCYRGHLFVFFTFPILSLCFLLEFITQLKKSDMERLEFLIVSYITITLTSLHAMFNWQLSSSSLPQMEVGKNPCTYPYCFSLALRWSIKYVGNLFTCVLF